MSGQRKKRHERCPSCSMHVELCYCSSIPNIDIDTRVVLVAHCREVKKTTNTGRLAMLTLGQCELHVRGRPHRPADLSRIAAEDRQTLLLFPRPGAGRLSNELIEADPRPVTLVVPDGTWGQARRAVRREPFLRACTAVALPPGPPSLYRLRREVFEGGMATIEAIARALGIIEGTHVQLELERLLDIMVERTLSTRRSGVHLTPRST